MRVLKFGGTSVADAAAIRRVIAIVRATPGPRVVVVSALAGVTNALVGIGETAADDRERALQCVDALTERHRVLARAIRDADRRRLATAGIDGIAASARSAVSAIAEAGGPRGAAAQMDRLLATGEVWSSRLVSALFEDAGLAVRWVDARHLVRTDRRYGAARPDFDATSAALDKWVRPALAFERIVVTAGFIGSAPDGTTTTLGRGGSDYSAAILGACLRADEIQIWTDVDGILTADPRQVAHARPLERLSYAEAHDLATFGARVLHPATIQPAASRGIPVRVLNSMRLEAAGTLIGPDDGTFDEDEVTAVTSRGGLALVEIVLRDAGSADSLAADVFRQLARCGLAPVLADLCGPRLSVAVDASADLEPFRAAFAGRADLHVRRGLAAVCAVGRGWRRQPSFMREAFTILGDTPVHLVARPSAVSPLALVVDEADALSTLLRLHDGFVREENREVQAS